MSDLSITSQFEAIKKVTEKGTEYWTARELQPRLGYANWQNFAGVIKKAIAACEGAGMTPGDHYIGSSKMVPIGSGAQRTVEDFILSRHACFLIAMNGESTLPEISAAQTYFAIQTSKQEKFERELEQLGGDQKRVMLRNELSEHNKNLASAAKGAGVVTPFDYAIFQDEGYKVSVSVFNGPIPAIQAFPSPQKEIEAISQWLKDRAAEGYKAHKIGVFVRFQVLDSGCASGYPEQPCFRRNHAYGKGSGVPGRGGNGLRRSDRTLAGAD